LVGRALSWHREVSAVIIPLICRDFCAGDDFYSRTA
jgi:hypothetical protein